MALPMVTIQGTLVEDPTLRYTHNGVALLNMRLAANERKRQPDGSWQDGDATYITAVAWRSLAENASESLKKGMRVVVTGRLRQREYEKDGAKKVVYEIDADDLGPSLSFATATVARTFGAGKSTPVPDTDVPF